MQAITKVAFRNSPSEGAEQLVRRAKSMILPLDKSVNVWYSYIEAKFKGRFLTRISKDI